MRMKVNIQGAGLVNGAGEYASGDTISLEAIPAQNMTFKGFLHNGNLYSTPYDFEVGDEDVVVTAIFYMTMGSYVKSLGYPVTDAQVYAILSDLKTDTNADVSTVSLRIKDLAYAKLIMLAVLTPNEGSTREEMGNWTSQKGGRNLVSRSELIKIAKGIYVKYGVTFPTAWVRNKSYQW